MIDLIPALYKSIEEENEVRDFKNWHCSSIAECPRSHYYKRMKVPALRTAGAGKMLRWEAGHIIEEVIRPHLLKLYPDLTSNVRMTSKKLDLTGEYDNYSPKEKTIFEIKSVHVFAISKIEKSMEPYLNHEYQNHGYKLLMEEEGLEVDKVTYIYIALDGRMVAVSRPIQPKILDGVKKRLEVLRKGLDGQLPPCFCKEDHPLWKSTMQYCDYKNEATGECCSPELEKK